MHVALCIHAKVVLSFWISAQRCRATLFVISKGARDPVVGRINKYLGLEIGWWWCVIICEYINHKFLSVKFCGCEHVIEPIHFRAAHVHTYVHTYTYSVIIHRQSPFSVLMNNKIVIKEATSHGNCNYCGASEYSDFEIHSLLTLLKWLLFKCEKTSERLQLSLWIVLWITVRVPCMRFYDKRWQIFSDG